MLQTHTNRSGWGKQNKTKLKKRFPKRGVEIRGLHTPFERSLDPSLSFSAAPRMQPGSSRAESREAPAAPGAGSALRIRGCQRALEADVGGVGLWCLSEDGAVSEPLAAGGHQSVRGWGSGRERRTSAQRSLGPRAPAPTVPAAAETTAVATRDWASKASWCSRKEGGAVARTSRPWAGRAGRARESEWVCVCVCVCGCWPPPPQLPTVDLKQTHQSKVENSAPPAPPYIDSTRCQRRVRKVLPFLSERMCQPGVRSAGDKFRCKCVGREGALWTEGTWNFVHPSKNLGGETARKASGHRSGIQGWVTWK